jgi:hypothetical protein
MNSTIIRKKKQLGCGCFDYSFSRNRCKLHATIEDTKKRAEKYAAQPTVRKAGWFDPNKVEEVLDNEPNFKTAIQAKKEMDAFWKYAESVIDKKPYCWECGDFISKGDYRAATAHIFPKSIFESVASNKWNFLVLGARCGCHDKSHRLDLFSQMKVFPTAINRYTKFGDLITETHKYKNLFIEHANKNI